MKPSRWVIALATAIAALAAASSAPAYVTEEQGRLAALRAAFWFQAEQRSSGELTGDWAMTALASAGISAHDLRASPTADSAQDFYVGDWAVNGPGGAVTDAARAVLTGHAGGIQTSRLTTDEVEGNMVSRLIAAIDGANVGGGPLLNDDVFALLALRHAGAPQELLRSASSYLQSKQTAAGGYGWSTFDPEPDTDMTGAAIAALCASGVPAGDPNVEDALAWLETVQGEDTGGFVAPWMGPDAEPNADSTGWVASGLIQCGIDPQGERFTTSAGRTPLDFLASLQLPSGAFSWMADPLQVNAFATWDSARPLAGEGFTAPPAAPADGVTPPVREAPEVAEGAEVPVSLVIDHGAGASAEDRMRACRVVVRDGSDIAETLAEAAGAATPGGCVGTFATAPGAGGGLTVTELNEGSADDEARWMIQVDGSPAEVESDEPIGFGDLVHLRLASDSGTPPSVHPPPVVRGTVPRVRGPRTKVARRALRLRGRRIAVRLRCPRGLGPDGCRGVVRLLAKTRRWRGMRVAGSSPFGIRSGKARTITVRTKPALRRRLRASGRGRVVVEAVTRGSSGSIKRTRARRAVRARR